MSTAADVVKFAVTHHGRVKCAARHAGAQVDDGIVGLQDARAPPINAQVVVFDPAEELSYWPSRFEHAKAGLLGGSLGAANVGAFSPAVGDGGRGFELPALG